MREVQQKLQATVVCTGDDDHDYIAWKATADGMFNAKIAYLMLLPNHDRVLALALEFQCGTDGRALAELYTAKSVVMVGWAPPVVGWVKLNMDGASKGNSRAAGCRGLFRNSNGE